MQDPHCSACRKPCFVTRLDAAISYEGPGGPEIHYPSEHGAFVSECCEVDVVEKCDLEGDDE